jgi:alpha-methylacyl-CoA racemase
VLTGALDGIKVLELGRVPPAELPGMMLSDMGADVLKIETPRQIGPNSADARREAAHAYTNRNKRSIALDMKAPEGAELFRRLAREADVVIEGFRPGVMARLGADYQTLSALNQRIVYCSISGFGQAGPYREYPAHDLNFLGLSGVLGLIGEPPGRPMIPLNLVADYGGAAMHAALGIMFALFARERSGRGQHVDVSYLDTTIALLAASPNLRRYFSAGPEPQRGEGVFCGSYPYYSIYDTRDGLQLTVACSEPWLWENFCRAIGRPEFAQYGRQPEHYRRAPNAEELASRAEVAEVLRTRDRDEWNALLLAADACVGKVYGIDEMVQDPQVQHRRMVVDIDHPEWGPVRQFGTPIKLSGSRAEPRAAAPAPGEHTDDVLRQLGLTQSEIERLREKAVVA